jgi:hypothetical protein
MDGDFVWIASGDTGFTGGSTQIRQLAGEGLTFKGSVFRIPEAFINPEEQ